MVIQMKQPRVKSSANDAKLICIAVRDLMNANELAVELMGFEKKSPINDYSKKMSKECWILSPNYITKLNRNGTEIELKWIGIKAGD